MFFRLKPLENIHFVDYKLFIINILFIATAAYDYHKLQIIYDQLRQIL